MTIEEWKPSPMPKLDIQWTCIVCHCDEKSGRGCRVICRPEGALTASHVVGNDRLTAILSKIAHWKHPPGTAEEQNEAYARDVDGLVWGLYRHFKTDLDDVICDQCDVQLAGKRWKAIAEDAHAMVVNFWKWAERTRDAEVTCKPPRDPRRIVLEAAWGLVIRQGRDLADLIRNRIDG